MQTRAKVVALLIASFWAASTSAAAADKGEAGGEPSKHGSIQTMEFGETPGGGRVELYTLSNGRITVKIMTYGATVTEIHAPDRDGKTTDVVLGFDDLRGYLAEPPYFGA